jgi:hypothetical protein
MDRSGKGFEKEYIKKVIKTKVLQNKHQSKNLKAFDKGRV